MNPMIASLLWMAGMGAGSFLGLVVAMHAIANLWGHGKN